MERPIFKPIGSPVEELDTPALVVDLDKLESNIETAHSFFEGRASKLRPRVIIHGCPAVAHMQLGRARHRWRASRSSRSDRPRPSAPPA